MAEHNSTTKSSLSPGVSPGAPFPHKHQGGWKPLNAVLKKFRALKQAPAKILVLPTD